jgi:hypothetical protein
MLIYDAAMRYQAEGLPTIILAGAEYGSGSSRDWAAKGPYLQVRICRGLEFQMCLSFFLKIQQGKCNCFNWPKAGHELSIASQQLIVCILTTNVYRVSVETHVWLLDKATFLNLSCSLSFK